MSNEIIDFLSPSPSHPIEVVFFSIILGGALLSLIASELSGRRAAWERNWQGSKHSSALDIEHGSIGELSQAVATLAERIASSIPGLLLIFGLLGTFLGLGLALDKASNILQGSDESLNAMSSSLSQLTGMMQDLGTKFKTSTWGIIAFIALKLWESARWSAENRRTTWCLRQMKGDIDQGRRQQALEREARNVQAREELQTLGQRLVEALAEQSRIASDEAQQLRTLELQHAQARQELVQHMGNAFENLNTRLHSQHEQVLEAQQTLAAQHIEATVAQGQAITQEVKQLKAIAFQQGQVRQDTQHKMLAGFESLDARLDNQHAQIQQQHDALNQRSIAAITAQGEATTRKIEALQAATLKQGQARQEQSHKGFAELGKQLSRQGEQLRQLEPIAKQGERSVNLLDEFVSGIQDNIQVLQQAGTTMGHAAEAVASSASALQTGVDALGERMNQVLDGMQADLGNTINRMNDDFSTNLQEMGTHLQGTIGHLGQVMEGIKTDLGQTIEAMSADFKDNTLTMAHDLGKATANISDAVNNLSTSVGSVMEEVTVSTRQANEMQKKTSVQFSATSDHLNEATVTMTEQMTELGKEIKSGLSAVSKCGLQMGSIATRLESFPELAQQFERLDETAKASHDSLKSLGAGLDKHLAQQLQAIRDGANGTQQVLGALREDIDQASRALSSATA